MNLQDQIKFIRDVIDNEHGGVIFDGQENVEPDWDAITMYLEAGINPPAKDERHNGWTNYATWRVNLECIDGNDADRYYGDDVSELAESMKSDIEAFIEDEAGEETAKSYAEAFISDVNWYEIAEAFAEEHELFKDEDDARKARPFKCPDCGQVERIEEWEAADWTCPHCGEGQNPPDEEEEE